MNNKEKLKLLIREAGMYEISEPLAEYLDSSGVIALPVRITDLLYAIGKFDIKSEDGNMPIKTAIDELIVTEVSSSGFWAGEKYFPYWQIGLNVFFNRENAERAAAFWLGEQLGKMDKRVQEIQRMQGGGGNG